MLDNNGLYVDVHGMIGSSAPREVSDAFKKELNEKWRPEVRQFVLVATSDVIIGDYDHAVGFLLNCAFCAHALDPDVEIFAVIWENHLRKKLAVLGRGWIQAVATYEEISEPPSDTDRERHRQKRVEQHLFVIKGRRELKCRTALQARYLQSAFTSRPARFGELDRIDQWVGKRLAAWGFDDRDWSDNFRTAVNELLTNVVENSPKGPRGGCATEMHVGCFLHCDATWDYVTCFLSNTDGKPPIPVRKLRTRGFHLRTRGRGTDIVKGFTDLFCVIADTDGVVIMKKRRHVEAPSGV